METNNTITLLPANESHIDVIADLAHNIWNAYYPSIISTEQVDYMLGKFYSKAALVQQMEQGQLFYIIQNKDAIIGFIAITIQNPKEAFINKFYLLSNCQQKGVGTAVFNKILEQYAEVNTFTLTVNRQNYKAINFYFKINFRIKETLDIAIGNNFVMNDFVMIFSNN
jgi:ribosomal protein S18 acetylase RimI-like enzyme